MPPFYFSRKCKKREREKKSSSGRRRHSNKLSSCIQIFIRRVVNSRFRFRVFFGFSVSCAACLSFVSPKFFFPGTPREQKKKLKSILELMFLSTPVESILRHLLRRQNEAELI